MFSCECYESFKKTYLEEYPQTAGSLEGSKQPEAYLGLSDTDRGGCLQKY